MSDEDNLRMQVEETLRIVARVKLGELNLTKEDYVLITLNRKNEIEIIYSNEAKTELIERASKMVSR